MARDLKAKIRLEADTRQANKALGGVQASVAKMAAAITAGAASFAVLTKAMVASVQAAIVQENAIAGLDNQLKQLGPTADAVSAALQRQASELQQVSTFGDEQIIQAQTRIASFTKEQSQIEALTRVTIDFAAAKGVDLATAAELISKTFGSSTNALSRYGVAVEGVAGSTERLTQLTSGLDKLFGGSAQVQAETFGGLMERLSGNIGDTAENVGELVTQSNFLLAALVALNNILAESNAKVDESSGFWNRLTALMGGAAVQQDDLGDSAGLLAANFDRLLDSITPYGPQIETAAQRTARITKEMGLANRELKSFDLLFREATQTLTEFNDVAKVPGIDDTLDALKELGVVLDAEVNEALQDNADLLIKADELYRLNRISRSDLAQVEALVAQKVRETSDELAVQSAALELSDDATLSYAEALKIARAELDELSAAEVRNGDTVVSQSERRRAARAQERGDSLLGANTPSGGTFFIPAGVRVAQNGSIFGVQGPGTI